MSETLFSTACNSDTRPASSCLSATSSIKPIHVRRDVCSSHAAVVGTSRMVCASTSASAAYFSMKSCMSSLSMRAQSIRTEPAALVPNIMGTRLLSLSSSAKSRFGAASSASPVWLARICRICSAVMGPSSALLSSLSSSGPSPSKRDVGMRLAMRSSSTSGSGGPAEDASEFDPPESE